MERQVILSPEQVAEGTCPRILPDTGKPCGATLEVIRGHWLLRDCALCAWCRSWYALPPAEVGTQTFGTGSFSVEPTKAKKEPGN